MKELKQISDGFRKLFYKNPNRLEFFMLSQNCLKLMNDIEHVDLKTNEDELTL